MISFRTSIALLAVIGLGFGAVTVQAQAFDRHTSRFENPYDPHLVDHNGARIFDRIESLKSRISSQMHSGDLDGTRARELFNALTDIEQDARSAARGFGGRDLMDKISIRLDHLADTLDRMIHHVDIQTPEPASRHQY